MNTMNYNQMSEIMDLVETIVGRGGSDLALGIEVSNDEGYLLAHIFVPAGYADVNDIEVSL